MSRVSAQAQIEETAAEYGDEPLLAAEGAEGKPFFATNLGRFHVADGLETLKTLPPNSVDLVITSPPYDGQPKYGNGERYDRDWYQGFFLDMTAEIHRVLAPSGSFVLNYRSRRQGAERGLIQFELIFWLRDQGFLFCEDSSGASRRRRRAASGGC